MKIQSLPLPRLSFRFALWILVFNLGHSFLLNPAIAFRYNRIHPSLTSISEELAPWIFGASFLLFAPLFLMQFAAIVALSSCFSYLPDEPWIRMIPCSVLSAALWTWIMPKLAKLSWRAICFLDHCLLPKELRNLKPED